MREIIGLDIGSNTTKAVEFIIESNKKPLLTNYQIVESKGIGNIADLEVNESDASDFISRIIGEGKFNTNLVNISLPESIVFSRVIDLPLLKDKEIDSAIKFEAEQYIPLPMNEINFDYSVIDKNETGIQVMIVAAAKAQVFKFVNIVTNAGLQVQNMEPEAFSIARSVITDSSESQPTMIVKIGKSTTDIAIALDGTIRFTRTMTTAGDAMTRAVEQTFNFTSAQAEEYKRSYGLNEAELEGKIGKSIQPVFDVILSEIKRALAYYRSKYTTSVKRIVLVGGSANMPNLLFNLASVVDVEVLLGNPWVKIDYSVLIPDNKKDNLGVELSTAIGVAIKEDI